MIDVHATAVIHPTASLAPGVLVGPYAIIGENAYVGPGTRIGPHAIVEAFTSVGRDCQIHAGAVVGGIPQDLKFQGDESYCVIGDRNIIREHVTINRATAQGEATRIGHDNLLMAYVHVAHDCRIGDGNVLANGVTLAGHVVIEDHVTIGGMTGLHQFIRVGALAMVGAMSRLAQDVPPYMLVEGSPPKVYGPNAVGLRRQGVDGPGRMALKRAYKLIYRSRLNLGQALTEMGKLEPTFEVRHLIGFLQATERGISGLSRTDAGLEAEA
ncbi:MAG: acyl-(acyl-carrier-protein)--UDP-N-acetylglucosamine O-acyltransferase [Cyanobacteria bacterium RYN_339]|nr:acyl-(acyl-carrier-protein)--UDP-N-acetylglucosamine O-acyltransferase [Cyanobacteria bacterium RYN_339]